MALEKLYPTSIVEITNLQNDITAIQNDETNPNNTWMQAIDNTSNVSVRVMIENIGENGELISGREQTISTLVRLTQIREPQVIIHLYQSGTLITSSSQTTIYSTSGEILSLSFFPADLVDPSGNNLEVVVEGIASGGNPNQRSTIDIGSIVFNADVGYVLGVQESEIVTGVNAELQSDYSVLLTWDQNSKTNIVFYHIRLNDVWHDLTTPDTTSYVFESLEHNVEHEFEVYMEFDDGTFSPFSDPVYLTISGTEFDGTEPEPEPEPEVNTGEKQRERLESQNIIAQTNLNGNLDTLVSATAWMTAIDSNSNTILHTNMHNRSGDNLIAGATHTFTFVFRSSGTGTPTIQATLYQNGTLITSSPVTNVTSTSTQLMWLSFTTEDLVDPSGLGLEMYIEGVSSGGSTVEIRNFYVEAESEPYPSEGIFGIDVSEYQGAIDWQAVYDYGVRFAICRAYGMDKTANGGTGDARFEEYITGAKAVGLPVGSYFFASLAVPLDLTQATDQANMYVDKLESGFGVGNYGDLMPILDLEENEYFEADTSQHIDNLTPEEVMAWTDEFRNTFETRTGRRLGIYTDKYFVETKMNNFNVDQTTGEPIAGTEGNILSNMPLWNAAWTKWNYTSPPAFAGWNDTLVWQYSEDGKIDGVPDNTVDLNMMVKSSMDWMKVPSPPTDVSATQNNDAVVLSWSPNTEDDMKGYHIYRDGGWIGYVLTVDNLNEYSDFGATWDVQHEYSIVAYDQYDDLSEGTNILFTLSSTHPSVTTTPTTPIVNILSVTDYVISNKEGKNTTIATFSFDKEIQAWTVNHEGTSATTGTVIESQTKYVGDLRDQTIADLKLQTVRNTRLIETGIEITTEVTSSHLALGDNRINFYGQNLDGNWTPYNQE